MSLKDQIFNWNNETLDILRAELGDIAKFFKEDELRSILDKVVHAQQLDLLIDLADAQIKELLQINENKWRVIDALMEGDQLKALEIMNEMSVALKHTKSKLDNGTFGKASVKEESNIVQFRQRK